MKRVVIAVVYTGLAMLSMAAASLVQGAQPGLEPHQVSGDWSVTIKTVIATGGIVLPAAFTLGVVFTRLTESVRGAVTQMEILKATMTEALKSGTIRMDAMDKKVTEMHLAIATLRCRNTGLCVVDREPPKI